MNCQDMEKFVQVYLDREFAEEDRSDYERHLAECVECRRLARFEQLFKQQLKTGLARPHVPLEQRERLRSRIMTAIESSPPRAAASTGRWLLGGAAAAAAALLIVFFARPPASHSPTVADPVAAPQAELRSGDPDALRRWYRNQAGILVDPPQFSDGRTRLVGGRIDRSAATPAARLLYRRGDQDFSVTLYPPGARAWAVARGRRGGDSSVTFTSHEDRPAALFRQGELGYRITGDLDRVELRRLVQQLLAGSRRPHQPPPVDAVPVSSP